MPVLHIVTESLSVRHSEHIENIRPFVRRKTVLFNNILIIKEPRMSAIDRPWAVPPPRCYLMAGAGG